MRRAFMWLVIALPVLAQLQADALADPCGMVPPVYIGEGQPITRVGLQQTYVFYKDGVETFVIRPGFSGKVDEFGMLIPFPTPPAIRKVPDHVFPHIAAAVDPPEVVVDLRIREFARFSGRARGKGQIAPASNGALAFRKDEVRVVKKEAVGMYEVAVLQAGSAGALKKWMDEHGYKYPDGMDEVCEEYVVDRWCFVAVKTKVGQKEGANPKPAQRNVNVKLPQGANFDGHVQAMGFRFETDELVVPMRLSAFNEGELRNVVYLMTEGPRKIRSIPEEYVVRQIAGKELKHNVTQPLPLRIIGGTESDIPDWQRKNLPAQRNPQPKNGAAKELFATDLLAVESGELSLPHEEREKELLAIGESLGLRGNQIDQLHAGALREESAKVVDSGLKNLDDMTLTVVDGDFPREVLSSRNLKFAEYQMPARRNTAEAYDAKTNRAGGKKQGVLRLGAIDWDSKSRAATETSVAQSTNAATSGLLFAGFSLLAVGLLWNVRFRRAWMILPTVGTALSATMAHADPCGMVPPVYVGKGQPITRVGLQQTYVFYKDGIETFVIRPGFSGKVDEFGMLIPFPAPPAIRKVPDHIFPHIAAAVDPPEVVVDLRWELLARKSRALGGNRRFRDNKNADGLTLQREEVRVVREEAVGMYEVAVLEAGSPKALKKWMDEHGYKYPEGMDEACAEYVKDRWCFVAIKTKVGQKDGVDPKPAQRGVNGKMPAGSTFDGSVQAMGFRFPSDELVVPMRLSSFNAGDLRNVVYLMTDTPQKIRSIPEEYVVRQLTGEELFRNVTEPLPLRIIGGTEANIPDWQRKTLPQRRDPKPHNGAALELFAGDLKAITSGALTLEHEEKEKDLLAIGERLGLRGGQIDKLHADALAQESRKAVADSLVGVKEMTLTVVDGDFPREVLARKNLKFADYHMPARRNSTESYDTKVNRPGGRKEGVLKLGAIDWDRGSVASSRPEQPTNVAERVPSATVGMLFAGLSLLAVGLLWNVRANRRWMICLAIAATLASTVAYADPCGMVPPVYIGKGQPITRVGLQQTYVFHKDGVETFVIRPGYSGKVDEFGMLIPFPSVPAVRKVPDHVFPHLAAAVDPPEVVVDLRIQFLARGAQSISGGGFAQNRRTGLKWKKDAVRVVKKEAVGMYEVAVLEAGSSAALKKWMDEHGYKYPDGMDKVCDEYIEDRWCFVAVKTKVAQKDGVDPKPAQRNVAPNLPSGSTFDGHVQAMGFRFETDELVVPMRLSAFNEGELRNVVYLMTEGPRKIRSIPEEYVVRQVSGTELLKNVTQPLPLRIIGGTEKDIPDWQRKNLPQQRNPTPKNGAAKELFATDLLAVESGELSLPHEEREKELLAIGESLGLRGGGIDELHAKALAQESAKVVDSGLAGLKGMSLTVVDGDFPREVLSSRNLTFAEYKMPARRNSAENYDAKLNGPAGKKEGVLKLGSIDWESKSRVPSRQGAGESVAANFRPLGAASLLVAGLSLLAIGLLWSARRRSALLSLLIAAGMLSASFAFADPCGMVPPISVGDPQPIKRIGEQQTFVFHKDGVETFVIRPGFSGKTDEFGMLIPFPNPPALRKVPDHIFPHVASAIDPPEVVVDLRWAFGPGQGGGQAFGGRIQKSAAQQGQGLRVRRNEVRVVKQEAVGMYEVAVLEAGSAAALKKWMDKHGYKYPDGMDEVCEEYVEDRWCFVAVKTKVGQKDGVDPQPAQRNVNAKLPAGAAFDGHVQAMGFRFKSEQLVVPMRLSAFNAGELRNIVYLLTDKPQKIRSIPEEYVVRQISGEELMRNVTEPLPLRIIGGMEKDIPDWQRKGLPQRRDPKPHNAAAKELFAGDLLAVSSGELSLAHEEKEKDLLAIGERLGLRGNDVDKLHTAALAKQREAATSGALADLKSMSLTVVDGDFPREVLARKNLRFSEYHMPARRNSPENYDAKSHAPGAKQEGRVILGAIDWEQVDRVAASADDADNQDLARPAASSLAAVLVAAAFGMLLIRRRVWR